MISIIGLSGYELAQGYAGEYAKAKGSSSGGTHARPEQHAFFWRLGPLIQRTLDKCERENGLM